MPPRMLAPPAAAVPAAVVAWLPMAVPTVPTVPPTPPVTEVRVPSALIVAWVDPFCRNLPSQLFAEVRPFAGSVAGSISTAVPSKVALPSPRSLVAPGRAPAVAGVPALGISAPASATRKGRFCRLASLGACLGAKVARLQNHHLGRYVHNGCGSLERTAHGRHTRRARAGACATSKAKSRGKTAEFRIGACCARNQLEAENGANGRHLGLVVLCPGL